MNIQNNTDDDSSSNGAVQWVGLAFCLLIMISSGPLTSVFFHFAESSARQNDRLSPYLLPLRGIFGYSLALLVFSLAMYGVVVIPIWPLNLNILENVLSSLVLGFVLFSTILVGMGVFDYFVLIVNLYFDSKGNADKPTQITIVELLLLSRVAFIFVVGFFSILFILARLFPALDDIRLGSNLFTVALAYSIVAPFRDIISGITVLLDRNFDIDSVVEIDNLSGMITSMGLRNLYLTQSDGSCVKIPASTVTNSITILHKPRIQRRMKIEFNIAFPNANDKNHDEDFIRRVFNDLEKIAPLKHEPSSLLKSKLRSRSSTEGADDDNYNNDSFITTSNQIIVLSPESGKLVLEVSSDFSELLPHLECKSNIVLQAMEILEKARLLTNNC